MSLARVRQHYSNELQKLPHIARCTQCLAPNLPVANLVVSILYFGDLSNCFPLMCILEIVGRPNCSIIASWLIAKSGLVWRIWKFPCWSIATVSSFTPEFFLCTDTKVWYCSVSQCLQVLEGARTVVPIQAIFPAPANYRRWPVYKAKLKLA